MKLAKFFSLLELAFTLAIAAIVGLAQPSWAANNPSQKLPDTTHTKEIIGSELSQVRGDIAEVWGKYSHTTLLAQADTTSGTKDGPRCHCPQCRQIIGDW